MNDAVLVVGPSWVGDMVMAQSLFIDLKRRSPATVIDVLAPAWSVDLLKRMPEVRQPYVLDVGHGELGLSKRWRLGKQLRSQQYRQAIVLPRSFKAALVPAMAKIPLRTGFRSELRYGLINDLRELDPRLDQTVKRFVALGLNKSDDLNHINCPQPKLSLDQANVHRLIAELGLNLERPVVGLMPGAEYGPAKQWPMSSFAGLSTLLCEAGYQVWILGSQKEHSLGQQIEQYAGAEVINLCGKTKLVDVIDLIGQLKVAVSNDSGLMHIAAATGRPVVGIYGSSSPAYTPPLSDLAVIEYRNLSCSPCFKRTCPLGHYACLKEIEPEAVLQHILNIDNLPALI